MEEHDNDMTLTVIYDMHLAKRQPFQTILPPHFHFLLPSLFQPLEISSFGHSARHVLTTRSLRRQLLLKKVT